MPLTALFILSVFNTFHWMYLFKLSLLSIDSNDSACLLTYSIFLMFLRTPDELQTSSLRYSLYSLFPLSFGLFQRKGISAVYWALSLTDILLRKSCCVESTTVCTKCHTFCLKLYQFCQSHTKQSLGFLLSGR